MDPVDEAKLVRHPGSCPHCRSLDVVRKADKSVCRDCGCVFNGDTIIEHGMVDLDYSLEVVTDDGQTLWCDTLNVLFASQCDIAAGLKIKPGSSFTKWLKSRERVEGIIDDAETIQTMDKIVRKILKNRNFIKDPYNIESIEKLNNALPQAVRFVLTFKKR